jgi:hypothetical protein
MAQSREELKSYLKEGVLEVLFRKVKTGEERLMKCTLNSEVIDELMETVNISSGPGRAENDNVIRVFDVEKKDWRSFRIDGIISVKLL